MFTVTPDNQQTAYEANASGFGRMAGDAASSAGTGGAGEIDTV